MEEEDEHEHEKEKEKGGSRRYKSKLPSSSFVLGEAAIDMEDMTDGRSYLLSMFLAGAH